MRRVGAAVVGLLGAALYSDWIVLEPLLGGDLSPARSWVSELGARTRPLHGLVNALDVVSGVCLALFAGYLLRRGVPQLRAARLGYGGLALFGATTALDGLWPMACAPSIEAACTAGVLTAHVRPEDVVYIGLSGLSVAGVEASMLLLALGLRNAPVWTTTARAARWLFALTAPLTVIVAVLGVLDRDAGVPQRALIVLESVWVAALAVT